ncbi:hypothetical protein ACTFIT_008568 [Dictyostelium discoideum]
MNLIQVLNDRINYETILSQVEIIFKNNSKESILEFIKYYSSKDVYELIGNLYCDHMVIMFYILYSSDTKDQYLEFLNSINPYCCSSSSPAWSSSIDSKQNENGSDENGADEKREKYLHIQSIKCYFPLEWNLFLNNIKSYSPFNKVLLLTIFKMFSIFSFNIKKSLFIEFPFFKYFNVKFIF